MKKYTHTHTRTPPNAPLLHAFLFILQRGALLPLYGDGGQVLVSTIPPHRGWRGASSG